MASFVAIDVETANPFMGSICQIGAVKVVDGREVDSLSWLIDPKDYFDECNVRIHGITAAMVRGKPRFRDRYSELVDFVGQSATVSHTHFDRVSIARACKGCRREPANWTWFDSARVARRAWPEFARAGYGLGNLAHYLEIRFRHHDALEDARAAAQVVLRAIEVSGLTFDDWLHRVKQPVDPSRSDHRRTGDGDGPLLGETVVFTGALSLPRSHAADRAHELGAAVADGVNRRTTMLVVGDQDLKRLAGHSRSLKHRKAEALIAQGQSIRIVGETDFMAFQE